MYAKINNITKNVVGVSTNQIPSEEHFFVQKIEDYKIYKHWYKYKYEDGTFLLNGNNVNPNEFIYNNKTTIGSDNFRENYKYNLKAVVTSKDINNLGDIVSIKWYKNSFEEQINGTDLIKETVLAIEETRVYTRTVTGVEPFEVPVLKKDTTIAFYKQDGSHTQIVLPPREYNDKDRKDKDQKSRVNLLEKLREQSGFFIAGDLINQGKNTEIPAALTEAKLIFNNLNKEINQYKFERLNAPLLTALNNYPRTHYITNDLIAFIISKLDVKYYSPAND